MTNAFATLVSIDGWRNSCGGWDWNDQHKLREYSREELEPVLGEHDKNRPRRIFAFLRAEGYLSDKSKGRVRLDVSGSDPDYLTIEDKNTGEPIFALIVGWDHMSSEDIRACQTELGAAYSKHLDDRIHNAVTLKP